MPTLIIDSHCHAWTYWPYEPSVPDPESRGVVEQLLHEMDQNGVDQALIVCAEIDHNPENNAYIATEVAKHPTRLHQVADVDSSWKASYHQPGAAARLQAAVDRWQLKGFTHYLKAEDTGDWLFSEEGMAFFKVAAENNLIASISCQPHHQPAIRQVADRFLEMPILIHHLGHPPVTQPDSLKEILASARCENIHIKLSGFYYSTAQEKWDYPLADVQPIVRAEYEHFGPQRMCWGSDYPVVQQHLTYRQALEKFRTHCDFVPEDDQTWILGKTLAGLLAKSGKA
jgi:predicted TIM-barrel fold metal-dependent hydrolase